MTKLPIQSATKLQEEADECSELLIAALDRESDKDEIIEDFRALLSAITDPVTCKKCGEKIWFVSSKRNKYMPITANGINHFADCKFAKEFRSVPR